MNTLHKLLLITTGFENENEAEASLLYLLENKLVACGHVYKERSMYNWNDALHKGDEWMLSVKTLDTLWEEVKDAIKAMHPYEMPMIIAMPVVQANEEYAAWVAGCCNSDMK